MFDLMKLPHIISTAVLILLVILGYQDAYTQQVSMSRQTLSCAGGTFAVPAGDQHLLIQQSIGQASVIGLHTRGAQAVRQGFLQPVMGGTKNTPSPTTLEVSFFPNPFDNSFTIQCANYYDELVTVELLDLTGRSVFRAQFVSGPSLLITPSQQSSGMYLLVVRSGNATFTSKIQQL